MSKYLQFVLVAVSSVSLAALSGCSGDDLPSGPSGGAPSTGGTGGSSGGNPNTPLGGTSAGTGGGTAGSPQTGDATKGRTVYSAQSCNTCHGQDASGGLGPNITGSMSAGIGSWTEAEFNRSVRESIGKNGEKLCASMVAYSPAALSDADLKDLHAYLLSVSNDTANRGNLCP